MDGGEHAVGYIRSQVLGAKDYDDFFAGEKFDYRVRDKLEGHGKNRADSNCDGGAGVEGVARAVVVSCSDILGRDRADA